VIAHISTVATLVVGLLSLAPTPIAAQSLQLPSGVVNPTDRSECVALSKRWAAIATDINQKHSSCISQPNMKSITLGDHYYPRASVQVLALTWRVPC
jgi:hypothetical protein